jgi:hypothetical protein
VRIHEEICSVDMYGHGLAPRLCTVIKVLANAGRCVRGERWQSPRTLIHMLDKVSFFAPGPDSAARQS